MNPEADPPAKLGLTGSVWLAYSVGILGAVLTIVQFVVWIADVQPPKGATLVLLLLIPFGVLLGIVAILAKQFQTHLTGALNSHQAAIDLLGTTQTQQLNDLAAQFARQAEQFAIEQARLATTLVALESHQRLSQEVGECAHNLSAEVAAHSGDMDESALRRLLKRACREFATTLRHSGLDCRVCVKQVAETEDHRLYAKTICRDNGSARDPVIHYIEGNTDFAELLNGDKDYWFCEDVTIYPNYQNSSEGYSYRSVLVWPILAGDLRQLRDEVDEVEVAIADEDTDPIVAFLCLDSDLVAAFNEQAHVPLGWSVADAMARGYEKRFQQFLTD